MKIGDTVRIKSSDTVGVITESVDRVIGSHVDKLPRWVVYLATTMRNHIFLEKDMEII